MRNFLRGISVALLMLIPVVSRADTHTAASCSQADVTAAISAASDGDIVVVPAGNCTWRSTLIIEKGIWLQGSGNNTPKESATFPLTIISNPDPAIRLVCDTNMSLFRVTGFRFQGGNGQAYIEIVGRGTGKKGLGAFRIDNNYFDHISGAYNIWNRSTDGPLYGLIDNNTFHDSGTDVYTISFWEFYQPAPSTCWGKDSWDRPFTWGSAGFNFVEDNLFDQPTVYQRHYVEHEMGGRSVIRHNIFNAQVAGSPDYIDGHGDCLSNTNGRGVRGGEIYANTFQGTNSSVGRNINLRGGQWLVYDNTFTTKGWAASPIQFTEYRASPDCSGCYSTSRCSPDPPACVTNSPSYYPLRDQIQGTYAWNNTMGGVHQDPYVDSGGYLSFYIQANRDYWSSASKPGALSTYTPFPYPHPLRAGPSAPSSLRIVNSELLT